VNRITKRLQETRSAGRAALVPYLMAGDPGIASTARAMHALVEGGADLIELGMPFSDPIADGPVIQAAAGRALSRGVSLDTVLDILVEFRIHDSSTPVLLMGYLNPIEQMGWRRFVDASVDAGADGLLLVDLPPEEAEEMYPYMQNCDLLPISLVAPTTDENRLRLIAGVARGFIYYIAVKGITGAAHDFDMNQLQSRIEWIRRHVDIPIGIGFGVRNADIAAQCARVADLVIVGSALVELLASQKDETVVLQTAQNWISELSLVMGRE